MFVCDVLWQTWHMLITQTKIKIMTRNFQDDPVLQVSGQEPSTSSEYSHEGPPILDTLLIKISTWNLQGIFLWAKQSHPWHQGWPCPPSILSGTFNVLQVPPWRTPQFWHTSNKDLKLRVSSFGSNQIIHDIKGDPVLQVSCQEPSLSSKYPP